MLEELAQDYEVEPIHIGKGAQFAANYLKKSPNAKVPAIEDRSETKPKYIFESGAILFYLAEKHNKFLGEKTTDKIDVIQWLMFQMGNLGPLLGQAHHFRNYSQTKLQYAIDRYTNEVNRLYGVLNKKLSDGREYIAEDYTIADMACIGWVRNPERKGQDLENFPYLKLWFERMMASPAVIKGVSIGADINHDLSKDLEAQKILFVQKARD